MFVVITEWAEWHFFGIINEYGVIHDLFRKFNNKMSRKIRNIDKLPLYTLPKLYGWHLMSKQDIDKKNMGKIFKFIGANWWDLVENNYLPISSDTITIKTDKVYTVLFVNVGVTNVQITDVNSGDIYNIQAGKRSTINNIEKVMTFSSSSGNLSTCLVGSIMLILLNIQDLISGVTKLPDTSLFTDFLLMSGVPDKEQYINTVSIEELSMIVCSGWDCEEEGQIKSDFVELLLKQWKKVNPSRIKGIGHEKGIPKVVQWIWVKKDTRVKNSFTKLKTVFYKFMDTWIKRNPEFVFNIWNDNENFVLPKKYENIITLQGPDKIEKLLNRLPKAIRGKIKHLYYKHPNAGARSDTLRQVILYLEGGWYGDINDSACMAELEKLGSRFDYVIGIEPVIYVNNAIVGAKRRHIFSKSMLCWLAKNSKIFVDEWPDIEKEEDEARDDYVVSTTGPIAMTSVIFGCMTKKNNLLSHTLILPSSWVYPNYWIPESSESWLKPVSIFAHYDRRDFLKS